MDNVLAKPGVPIVPIKSPHILRRIIYKSEVDYKNSGILFGCKRLPHSYVIGITLSAGASDASFR